MSIIEKSKIKLQQYFASISQEKQRQPDQQTRLVDGKGRICPISIISEVDLARNTLVGERIGRAEELSKLIEQFKQETFAEIDAFIRISNDDHGAKIGVRAEGSKLGSWKGNLQLISYDQLKKIRVTVADRIVFNERLNIAMKKLEGLIKDHSGDIDEIIKVVVFEAFQVDKAGFIDAKKVLQLRRYKITNPIWEDAMKDIDQSIEVAGSRSYLQFWQRKSAKDDWQSIPLDIARL